MGCLTVPLGCPLDCKRRSRAMHSALQVHLGCLDRGLLPRSHDRNMLGGSGRPALWAWAAW
eukprot:1743044-Pyramimonas_sp.AAC.1